MGTQCRWISWKGKMNKMGHSAWESCVGGGERGKPNFCAQSSKSFRSQVKSAVTAPPTVPVSPTSTLPSTATSGEGSPAPSRSSSPTPTVDPTRTARTWASSPTTTSEQSGKLVRVKGSLSLTSPLPSCHGRPTLMERLRF